MSNITEFQTDILTITRTAAGEWTTEKGRYTPGATTVFDVVASVQPATPKETKLLPSHLQQKSVINVFTEEKLLPSNEDDNIIADKFNWRGDDYVVWGVTDWTNTDLPHYLNIAIKNDKAS